MIAILSIIIGIVFVLLLFSMLASTVVEVYHNLFSSRGYHLRQTLEIMLGKELCDKFYDHSYFRQISSASKPNSKVQLPTWIDKDTFSNILADILTPHDSKLSIPERIKMVKNAELRKVLDFLWRQTQGNVQLFQEKVENWFADIMARAKEWFMVATKWRLFFIGVTLAAVLNVDTFQIYRSLSANAAVRDELVKEAEAFQAANPSVSGVDTSKTFEQAKADYERNKQTFKNVVMMPLGLGWTPESPVPIDVLGWFIKVVGWLLSGVSVTLGAPFWYDMLRKLLAIKGGASVKDEIQKSGDNPPPPADPSPAFEIKASGSEDHPEAVG